jgi:hypothetical protein
VKNVFRNSFYFLINFHYSILFPGKFSFAQIYDTSWRIKKFSHIKFVPSGSDGALKTMAKSKKDSFLDIDMFHFGRKSGVVVENPVEIYN